MQNGHTLAEMAQLMKFDVNHDGTAATTDKHEPAMEGVRHMGHWIMCNRTSAKRVFKPGKDGVRHKEAKESWARRWNAIEFCFYDETILSDTEFLWNDMPKELRDMMNEM